MKVLLIDNYDSFTFNVYQLLETVLLGTVSRVDVIRNDERSLTDIVAARYDRIVLSPGPGDPTDQKYFGVCADVLFNLGNTTPILGICLGMQGMSSVFGGRICPAKRPMHGKTSRITHDCLGVFAGLPQGIEVMRYHSLVVDPETLPPGLLVTAEADGEIMGLRHLTYALEGVQFHPESFATEGGEVMMRNFLFAT